MGSVSPSFSGSSFSERYPNSVTIFEMGPRDGLQNEQADIQLEDKIRLVEGLANAGLKKIETGAFVSPKWVPQMADSSELFKRITRKPGVVYTALTPNMKGFEAAVECGADEIAVFGAASETFTQKNINCSIAESIERFVPIIEAAKEKGIPVRGYVSCVVGCPYEGEVEPAKVAEVAKILYDLGCYEVSLGDTVGVGTPIKVQRMLSAVFEHVPVEKVAVHFHDTFGMALSNILMALQMGISTIDSSVAGLGGCPYAGCASGNVGTEDVVYLLHGMGIETGIDLAQLAQVGRDITKAIGKDPQSKIAKAIMYGNVAPQNMVKTTF
ncbi:hydroxymethylglutaryl-CoA lyase [Paraneptunicella aestuarii]|uniref:hydroxymethylglutaryl-CoA lyase n=1 Tax=Paraneptunicella aestuarii TaxID=2831148 RepID=UPI001E5ACB4E|nr:hydroxymethylglutaryl-CoA lyase [Paraneptunicella aestuarii]UAA40251.1 hydroxymethylglutaryl-CoA lyase [Paraneptunicella aestuarii]